MNLFLLETAALRDGCASLEGAQARHAIDVLRVSPGQEIRVGVVDGPTGTARVTRIDAGRVELHCTLGAVSPAPDVDLLLALPRPKVLRRLWAQLAALGVGRIILTNAARVERNYFDTHVLTPECYRPLLIEGLQQARDTQLPQVSVHKQFKVLVEDKLDSLSARSLRLVADPDAAAQPGTVVQSRQERPVLIAIGPEGGWNEFEIALLQTHNFVLVGMGPRTLRTDTACIALLTLIHDALRSST